MRLVGLVRLVLADRVSTEQVRALAAVMLGLVVFAAVFALLERRRRRRVTNARKDQPADQASVSGPPVAAVDPVARPDPPAPRVYEPPLAASDGTVRSPMSVVPEQLPTHDPAGDHHLAAGTPASPAEIGIVIPEDEPPHSSQEPPPLAEG